MSKDPEWLATARRKGLEITESGIKAGSLAQEILESPKPIKPVKPPSIAQGRSGSVAVLWLPGFTPTSVNLSDGRHWSEGYKLKRSDKEIVAFFAEQQGLSPANLPRKVSLRITLPKGQRSLDKSNVWKSLLDALHHAWLIVNDSPQWCEEGKVEYVRHHADLRETFILLEDIDQ